MQAFIPFIERTVFTSPCPDDTYGPQCNVFCDEQPNNYTCNYLGEKICVSGYEDPTAKLHHETISC